MKKAITIILCLALCLAPLGMPAFAADEYDVDFNEYGLSVHSDVAPFLHAGRAFAPISYFADAFRIYMTWDEPEQTATLERFETTVRFAIGSDTITIIKNDTASSVNMGVAPMIVSGIVCVPIRFIAEAFDLTVEWKVWNKGQGNDENWFDSAVASILSSVSEKTSVRQVIIRETVPEMRNTTFLVVIGIKELVLFEGGFYTFIENDHFRFAYRRPFIQRAVHASYMWSLDAAPDGNSIVIREPFRYGVAGGFFAACESPEGTSFEDLSLESVFRHISAGYETVEHEYTTFNGLPSVSYNLSPPVVVGEEVQIISGIAFFHDGLLFRFEYCERYPEERVETVLEYGVTIKVAKPYLDTILLTLVIK